MKEGKIPADILNKYAYPYTGIHRNEVLSHAGLGEDCSIIDFGENVAVLSTDPITASNKNSGHLSVIISCNDVASCGAKPIGILVTILLPDKSNEETFKNIMKEINDAAQKLNVEILGGHSEITSSVNKPVINTTAIGITKKEQFVTTSGAKVGDDVIITKSLGLEGTAILATDHEDTLLKSIPSKIVYNAKNFIKEISVLEEGLIAAKTNATAMHDITEGGLLGAAYEVAEASNVGIEIYEDRLPISDETRMICDYFKINPLGLISSGSMFITAKDGQKVLEELRKAGINATIIGKITTGGKYLIAKENKIPIVPLDRDEIYNIQT